MCGACGELRLDGRVPDVSAVATMAETMVDRGPDGAGVWSAGRVALGHRRLKIIDLSEAGAQPMVDPELGLAIAWNGCIYNYPMLRAELSSHGYRFFSHSDTEVLIKAYHHWGDRFVVLTNLDAEDFRPQVAVWREPKLAGPWDGINVIGEATSELPAED